MNNRYEVVDLNTFFMNCELNEDQKENIIAALSLRTHDSGFKEYYLRKTKEGKAKRLVINNIQNKLHRVICAVLRTNRPYIHGYTSLHPESIKIKKCA